jgi:hypothetical protein
MLDLLRLLPLLVHTFCSPAATVGAVNAESPPSLSQADGARVPTSEPGVARYRCGACGNLTRFDVVTSRRTRAFHHFSVGGDLSVEDVEVLEESVEDVTCRWCGNGTAIEVIEDDVPEAG